MSRPLAMFLSEIDEVKILESMLAKESNKEKIDAIKAEIEARQNKAD